jgi:hypothetical protein
VLILKLPHKRRGPEREIERDRYLEEEAKEMKQLCKPTFRMAMQTNIFTKVKVTVSG